MAIVSPGRVINNYTRSNAGASPPGHAPRLVVSQFRRTPDFNFGGTDYVAGVVEINGVPSFAKLRLHDTASGLPVDGGWTDKSGAFRFERLSPTLKFYVVAFDPVTGEQAVVFDRI